MDVSQLAAAGLVRRTSDKVNILSAKDRRRDRAIEDAEDAGKGGKVHPNDVAFKTALDGCHTLALRYAEAGGYVVERAGTQSIRPLFVFLNLLIAYTQHMPKPGLAEPEFLTTALDAGPHMPIDQFDMS